MVERLRLTKAFVLGLISLVVSVGVSVSAFYITRDVMKNFLIEKTVSFVENNFETTAMVAQKREDLSPFVLRHIPYISKIFVGKLPKELASEKQGVIKINGRVYIKKTFFFPNERSLDVAVLLDSGSINKEASEMSMYAALGVFFVSAVAWLIVLFSIRDFYVKPLKKIKTDIEQIMTGKKKRLPVSSNDEFSKVRESINSMLSKLENSSARDDVLYNLTELLAQGKTFGPEFTQTIRRLMESIGIDAVVIGIECPEEKWLRMKFISQHDDLEFCKDTKDMQGLALYVYEMGREAEASECTCPVLRDYAEKIGIKYTFGVPLISRIGRNGFMLFCKTGREPFTKEEKKFLKNIARSLSIALDVAVLIESLKRKLEDERQLIDSVIRAFVKGIEARDTYTRGHSERVSFFARRIAQEMGLPKSEVEKIAKAAILHDIGKIGIPDAILLKPGKLTPEEREIIKLHPLLGYELLKDIKQLEGVLEGIKYHHERLDGSGYPEGLKGDEIPLAARIIAVADVFDAMTSDRAYRKARTKEEAAKELLQNAGKLYDPEVVKTAMPILTRESLKVEWKDFERLERVKSVWFKRVFRSKSWQKNTSQKNV